MNQYIHPSNPLSNSNMRLLGTSSFAFIATHQIIKIRFTFF